MAEKYSYSCNNGFGHITAFYSQFLRFRCFGKNSLSVAHYETMSRCRHKNSHTLSKVKCLKWVSDVLELNNWYHRYFYITVTCHIKCGDKREPWRVLLPSLSAVMFIHSPPSTWIPWLGWLRFGMFHHPAWAVSSYSSGPPSRGNSPNLSQQT